MRLSVIILLMAFFLSAHAEDFPKPFSAPRVEREQIFSFTKKPLARYLGNDKYEITFAVKGNCDVTVAVMGKDGVVVRHLASGVLGSNAPEPLQKNSLSQKLIWDGKDDLGAYPKDGKKLKIRVMLGLKPTFDKRLGSTSPMTFPGKVWGLAIKESGAYLFIGNGGGFSHKSVRQFDRDGNYVKILYPPSANTPKEKMTGSGFVEYEKGKRAWHGPDLYSAISQNGLAFHGKVDYKAAAECQIAVAGNRLLFLNAGKSQNSGVASSMLFSINADGSTDQAGLSGRPFAWGGHFSPNLVGSPDGKWVYMVCSLGGKYIFSPCVVRGRADGSKKATEFFGSRNKTGSDNKLLNGPTGLGCDAKGRVYVADSNNSRIQIVSPEGKYLKTIKVERPRTVRVHQKTGAIYVQHSTRVKGKSFTFLTKFKSFDDPAKVFSVKIVACRQMAIDSWSAKPRLWFAGGIKVDRNRRKVASYSLRIMEENGKELKLLRDFGVEARKEDGANYSGGWSGSLFDKVVCDPVREQVYYSNSKVFDLKSGKYLGRFSPDRTCRFDDIAFDKHGYMHAHFNPCFFGQGVGRLDPTQVKKSKGRLVYPEVPYDYGIGKLGWRGVLPTKDQQGPKGFQDGLGVNMAGDIAEQCNIYHLPRMEEEGWSFAAQSINARRARGEYVDGSSGRAYNNFAKYAQMVKEKEKRGETVYAIKRRPGIPLVGGTVWTFDRHGELLKECAVIAGDIINGVQIDEKRSIYFVNARPKYANGKSFLAGKGGWTGVPKAGRTSIFTGTLIKTKPETTCNLLMRRARVQMDPLPNRAPDLFMVDFMKKESPGEKASCWVEGHEWLYAGASPIVSVGCSCPRQHLGLDWYRRSYVPEAYRHSIGVLDTNGNLILHIGQFGNFDSGLGSKSKVKVGGDEIGMMITRFISATDNYLAYGDWGERFMVLKLGYHAEETVSIKSD